MLVDEDISRHEGWLTARAVWLFGVNIIQASHPAAQEAHYAGSISAAASFEYGCVVGHNVSDGEPRKPRQGKEHVEHWP